MVVLEPAFTKMLQGMQTLLQREEMITSYDWKRLCMALNKH